jgi:hypothetical protein
MQIATISHTITYLKSSSLQSTKPIRLDCVSYTEGSAMYALFSISSMRTMISLTVKVVLKRILDPKGFGLSSYAVPLSQV